MSKEMNKLDAMKHLLWLGRRDKNYLSTIKQDYRKALRAMDAIGLSEDQKLDLLRNELWLHGADNKPLKWLADRLEK